MTQYTAGWNAPGYLPDQTEPLIFDSLDDARDFIVAELEELGDYALADGFTEHAHEPGSYAELSMIDNNVYYMEPLQ